MCLLVRRIFEIPPNPRYCDHLLRAVLRYWNRLISLVVNDLPSDCIEWLHLFALYSANPPPFSYDPFGFLSWTGRLGPGSPPRLLRRSAVHCPLCIVPCVLCIVLHRPVFRTLLKTQDIALYCTPRLHRIAVPAEPGVPVVLALPLPLAPAFLPGPAHRPRHDAGAFPHRGDAGANQSAPRVCPRTSTAPAFLRSCRRA